jgi:general secretion pathway protein J
LSQDGALGIVGSRRGDAGFTLIELLVALALLGLIAALIFAGLRLGMQSWERSENTAVQVDDVGVTQALLRRLVAAAYPMFIPDPHWPHIDFAGASDRLTVLAPLPDALENGGLGRYTLFVRERADSSDLDLVWQPELARPGGAASAPREDLLLEKVARLEIAYFGAMRPAEAPRWHDHWREQSAFPELVRIRVIFPEGDGRTWPDLIVTPRLTVDESCLYDPVTHHCRGR